MESPEQDGMALVAQSISMEPKDRHETLASNAHGLVIPAT